MINTIMALIQDTIKDGIGQALIAFSAWAYTIILLIVIVYCLARRFLKMYFE